MIPENILKIARSGFVDLQAVVVTDGSAAVSRKRWHFIRGFGVIATLRFSLQVIRCRLAIWRGKSQDMKGAARIAGAEFVKINNIHDHSFVTYLAQLQPDVIASFSAPVVFRDSVLKIPRLACINLHCSLLPRYAGLLPSFWVLFNEETTAGASVHLMDNRIDNGAILGQRSIPVPSQASMYNLVQLTKDIGGDLMVQVLRELCDGTASYAANHSEAGSYFSWPTIAQIREFRLRGGRLA